MGKALVIKGADFSSVSVDNIIIAPTPIITISGAGSVTITCPGAVRIYYTINGDTPTIESDVYTTAFNVPMGTTVKAIAEFLDGSISHISSKKFTLYITFVNGALSDENFSQINPDTNTFRRYTSNEMYKAITDVVVSAPGITPATFFASSNYADSPTSAYYTGYEQGYLWSNYGNDVHEKQATIPAGKYFRCYVNFGYDNLSNQVALSKIESFNFKIIRGVATRQV